MTELLNAAEVLVGRGKDGKAEEGDNDCAVFPRAEKAQGCRERLTCPENALRDYMLIWKMFELQPYRN